MNLIKALIKGHFFKF